MLINYILSEIIDEFKDILIVTNEPINFTKSDKISLTSDFKKGIADLLEVFSAMKWIKNNNKRLQMDINISNRHFFFQKKNLIKFYKN